MYSLVETTAEVFSTVLESEAAQLTEEDFFFAKQMSSESHTYRYDFAPLKVVVGFLTSSSSSTNGSGPQNPDELILKKL